MTKTPVSLRVRSRGPLCQTGIRSNSVTTRSLCWMVCAWVSFFGGPSSNMNCPAGGGVDMHSQSGHAYSLRNVYTSIGFHVRVWTASSITCSKDVTLCPRPRSITQRCPTSYKLRGEGCRVGAITVLDHFVLDFVGRPRLWLALMCSHVLILNVSFNKVAHGTV